MPRGSARDPRVASGSTPLPVPAQVMPRALASSWGRSLAPSPLLPWVPQELRQYLSNLADQCASENNAMDMPLVIILDNLHHVSSLGEIFNGLLNCKDHKW